MILTALIFLFAGLLQGMTSFGFSLIALPLLTLTYDLQLIVPVLVIYSLAMNSTILINLWKNIQIKEIIWIALAGILFTPVGMQILLYVDGTLLKMVTASFIFIFSILLFFNKHIELKNEKWGYFLTGALSGLLNGSVSLSGPPMIIFMTNKGVEKQKFRANLTFYFWILNVITIPTFFIGGLLTQATISFSIKYVLFLILGVSLGVYIGNRIQENFFKRMVVIVLMALGIISFVSTLGVL